MPEDQLLEDFGDTVRTARSACAPGAARESQQLEEDMMIQAQIPLLGSRDQTYRCLFANYARIYKRWRMRDYSVDAADFRRGLAHVLILSCAGSGLCPASRS